jgi:hypothetical protein
MRRAVRKAGSKDFAQVARHLPEQTQEYLAKFYAAAYVSFHFQDFNIAPHLPLALSGGTKRIEVSEIHSFQELSRICKLSITKIKRLNPVLFSSVNLRQVMFTTGGVIGCCGFKTNRQRPLQRCFGTFGLPHLQVAHTYVVV